MIEVATLEIAVDSARDALTAAPFAQRIELCADLASHGTTPDANLIRDTVASLRTIPPAARPRLVALIRPRHTLERPAHAAFSADSADLTIMSREIEACIEAGADEICIGILDEHGSIDAAACKQLRRIDEPRVVAFHRAFDFAAAIDAARAVSTLADLGFRRTLAAGVPTLDVRALSLAPRLTSIAHAAQLAAPRNIQVIACGGVRPANAAAFGAITPHLHASCRDDAGMLSRGLASEIRGIIASL